MSAQVIEFSGLHGSGKTTTAYRLAEELSAAGYAVLTNQDLWLSVSKQSSWRRWLICLCSVYTWIFFFYAVKGWLRRLLKKNAYIDNKYRAQGFFGPLSDIYVRNRFYHTQKDKADYIIFDEGSIYVVADLFWKYEVPKRYLFSFLKQAEYLQHTIIYLFNTSVAQSIDRTSQRNGGSFMDELAPAARKRELEKVQVAFDAMFALVRDNFAVVALDADEDLSLRLQKIKRQIRVI